jgi:hypothetical protein
MMQTIRNNAFFLLLALLFVSMGLAACTNPFDPLSKSDAIRGLSYIDFSLIWDRWDSDPEGDGVSVTVEYFNEFGDDLEFRDKPHKVVIEFWTEKSVGGVTDPDTGTTTGGRPANDVLLFSYPVEHDFSDDDIRVPIAAYAGVLAANYEEFPEEAIGLFVLVRVFPPQQDPRPEVVAYYSGLTVYEPETALADPGTVPPPEIPPVAVP